tara:strand:- start:1775 stop:3289 length:1515 start_codon:yes stop_codon:yes gene_type:complete
MIRHSRKQRQLKHLVKQTNKLLAKTKGALTTQIVGLKSKIQKLIDELKFVMGSARLRKTLGSLVLVLGLAVGLTQAQDFAPIGLNTFGIQGSTFTDQFADFDLVDLDLDGDFDLVGSRLYFDSQYAFYLGGPLIYQENIGTSINPNFSPGNTIGDNIDWGVDYIYFGGISSMNSVDLDGDGDFDLVSTHSYIYSYDYETKTELEFVKGLLYIENTGSVTIPDFTQAEINPFGLDLSLINPNEIDSLDSYIVDLEFTDIDDDGDFDVLGVYALGDYDQDVYSTNLFLIENIGTSSSPSFAEANLDPFGIDSPFSGIGANVSSVDLDVDGDLDLILNVYTGSEDSTMTSELRYFENSGDPSNPIFSDAVLSPFNLVASPMSALYKTDFTDIDGDGDEDAFHFDLGGLFYDYSSTVHYQENIDGSYIAETSDVQIEIYPNPASDNLSISNIEVGSTVRFFDYAGKLVWEQEVENKSMMVDLSNFPSGVYSVELRSKDKTSTKKLLIE